MDRLPVVAIVGRQNVGKSSLLNALAGRRISIVDPAPGVTRDRVSAIVDTPRGSVELVDTAGMGMDRADRFHDSVERQIRFALEEADLVVFVVDAQAGPMPQDREVSDRLRRTGKPVLLAANKVDSKRIEDELPALAELGWGDPFPVSAVHRRGVGELLEEVVRRMPSPKAARPHVPRIAVVGRRNVGKSTLINTLAGQERVVVSEIPGTTRDAVDVRIQRGKKEYILVDTAGLRKRRKVEDSVELFSQVRTAEAIDRADAVLLMMDAVEKISEVDKRIAGLVDERCKPCVLVLNKWDRVPAGRSPEDWTKYLGRTLPSLRFAPVMMISALKGDRVWDLFKVAGDLIHQSQTEIPTPEVNRILHRAEAARSPGTRGTREPKIFYATQVRVGPPTFVVFVNDPANFTPDYVRFLENRFREWLPFHEVPIRLALKKRVRAPLRNP